MDKKTLYIRFDRLNQSLLKLFDLLAHYSDHELNQSPGQHKWSPTQIMNHLILSEKLSIAYCQKKLSFNPNLKKSGFMTTLRTNMIRGYLYSPLKFKAPSIINTPVLPKEDTIENIRKNWNKVRNDLKDFINDLPESMLDKELYKHPFGGRISVLGMLKVMEAHFDNHRKQIVRAISELKQ